MDYLFHCRDKPGSTSLLERTTEAHWSFMDDYADRLLARGPTLSADGEDHTGSLHIVRLASTAETKVFAYQEPFYEAGVYSAVLIRRWQDRLGRTMRDFKPNAADPLFLVLAHARTEQAADFGDAHRAFAQKHQDRLGVYGAMHAIDGTAWSGFAAVIQAPSQEDVETILADEPAIAARAVATPEIHRWCIGGRR